MDRGGVRRLALRAVRAAVAALTAVGDLLQRATDSQVPCSVSVRR